MSVIEEAKEWVKFSELYGYGSGGEDIIEALIKELEQQKAITEAAKFLIKVKRQKDTPGKGAWYLVSKPTAWRKLEEAVAGLKEKDGE